MKLKNIDDYITDYGIKLKKVRVSNVWSTTYDYKVIRDMEAIIPLADEGWELESQGNLALNLVINLIRDLRNNK